MKRLVCCVALVAVLIAPGVAAATDVPGSATDGGHRLTVSATRDLVPGGQLVTVTGSGYDVTKGIYVAFCTVPPAGQLPTPCGGGADTSGGTGASAWISSNPPSYGQGVATPYGAGGTFRVQLHVAAALNATTDCRRVACAVVTRNDHIRTDDRSQDVIVPVSFASAPASSGLGAVGWWGWTVVAASALLGAGLVLGGHRWWRRHSTTEPADA